MALASRQTDFSTPGGLRAAFRGGWLLERDILDLDSEWIGRFEGAASFEPSGETLHYREEGRLRFGGLEAIKATRSYIWTFPGGAEIAIRFEDDRPFHDFRFRQDRVEASHFCDPDQYDVAYDFGSWPLWKAEWRVEGPRKDYRMVSTYRRGSPAL